MVLVHYLDLRTWRPLCDAARNDPGSPQPENDAASPWTFVKESVTCSDCLRALEERDRGGHSR